MSLKRPRSPSPIDDQPIFRSAPVEDRASIFTATYSPTLSARALQTQPDFKSASHRIAAWRKPTAQRSLVNTAVRIYETGSDDDGEKYAGKRLEKVLEGMEAEGAVVVARWYGGVMLGPVRFSHIENCARQAIRLWRAKAAEAEKAEKAEATKRQKVEDERSKEALVRTLAERDQSINVLRGLLADKKGTAQQADAPTDTKPPAPAPKKQTNYGAMPVEALRRLERARDATISFILNEIDKAEEGQKRTNAADGLGDSNLPSQGADERTQTCATKQEDAQQQQPQELTCLFGLFGQGL
ncbi:uncharacterized protein K452DRAFT_348936 [Aplosporella prunicola CBS 121167]|uniref:Impact N-terminal domain-containing protein n=1 Tax=Aplosporella prunicola CBS 121167 TaxID=1176127 RepID=A0A6A6BNT0_9PEZI|nr:uncharacterized protein K452DRAFT_348936 [Aplosporella prunicola CBS 121167]KAF2145328.1 hypothetical protein K452DRAFT_348936 [Aplosporella prunicola CBS 121167]